MEAHQVATSRRAARVVAAVSLAASLAGLAVGLAGCATAPPPVPPPVVLATRCARGPFCVTGEVDDQFSAAVESAKCIALTETGQSTTVLSDARGVFMMDGLTALPHQIRFEKTGFNSQTVAVLAAAPGTPSPVYVIFHRIADGECSCEPSAIMAGHDPCPDDKCGRSRFDVTIPEAPPPPPAAPPP